MLRKRKLEVRQRKVRDSEPKQDPSVGERVTDTYLEISRLNKIYSTSER